MLCLVRFSVGLFLVVICLAVLFWLSFSVIGALSVLFGVIIVIGALCRWVVIIVIGALSVLCCSVLFGCHYNIIVICVLFCLIVITVVIIVCPVLVVIIVIGALCRFGCHYRYRCFVLFGCCRCRCPCPYGFLVGTAVLLSVVVLAWFPPHCHRVYQIGVLTLQTSQISPKRKYEHYLGKPWTQP